MAASRQRAPPGGPLMTKSLDIETLLRQHPAVAPVRPHLAQDSLRLAMQARRVRRTKRLVAAVFVIGALLLLGKWASNDLVYLLQLPFTKHQAIQSHGRLYLQAFWESLPKLPLLTTLGLAFLWLA